MHPAPHHYAQYVYGGWCPNVAAILSTKKITAQFYGPTKTILGCKSRCGIRGMFTRQDSRLLVLHLDLLLVVDWFFFFFITFTFVLYTS